MSAGAGFGIAPLARAFRDGSDDPVRALQRALEAAERGKEDRALLWRVPAAMPEAAAARLRFRWAASRHCSTPRLTRAAS